MKWISLAGALLAACLAVAPAKARDVLDILHGTLKAQAQPLVMEDGKTGGCTYSFVAIKRDHVYRPGQYLRVTGHLNLLKTRSFVGETDILPPWSTTLYLTVEEAWRGKMAISISRHRRRRRSISSGRLRKAIRTCARNGEAPKRPGA